LQPIAGFGRVQSARMSTTSGEGMREILERRIDQAMGRMAADLVVRNARILDLATGVFHSGDIAICGEMIVGTGDSYRGVREIDAGGRIAVPGFIDSHVHCESTLVVPASSTAAC
jgi:adenine deaminase